MKTKQPKIIEGFRFNDDRGCIEFLNDLDFKQTNIRRTYKVTHTRLGLVRGMHGHRQEEKFVQVIKGDFRIVLIKMHQTINKPDSQDYLQFYLSDNKSQILYVPAGYYNGFQNLSNEGTIQFFSTSTLEESKGDDFRFPTTKNDIYWRLDDYR